MKSNNNQGTWSPDGKTYTQPSSGNGDTFVPVMFFQRGELQTFAKNGDQPAAKILESAPKPK